MFRGVQDPFSGSCPLTAQHRLALVEGDDRDPFYHYWQVVSAPDCTVIFYDDDGVTEIGRVTVPYGEAVTPPAAPVKEEDAWFTYEFDGWYTAQTGGEQAMLYKVTQSFSVYAHYVKTEHVHRYTEKEIEPTCIKQGHTLYQFICVDIYFFDGKQLVEHRW